MSKRDARATHRKGPWDFSAETTLPRLLAANAAALGDAVALREKDRTFVTALLHAGLVDPTIILARLLTVDDRYRAAAARATNWLNPPQP